MLESYLHPKGITVCWWMIHAGNHTSMNRDFRTLLRTNASAVLKFPALTIFKKIRLYPGTLIHPAASIMSLHNAYRIFIRI